MNFKHLSCALCLTSTVSVLLPPSSTAKPKPRKSSSPIYRTIVPTSEKVSQTWKYTFAAPPAAWHQKDFNDSKWHTGQGGFGTHITPHIGRLGTVWKTSDIWLRRTFNPGTITAVPINVRDYHDEAVEIYINGTLVYSAKGYIVGYERKPLAAGAHRAIMSNAKNVMAVHCHQTTGGQYIDVGLEQVIAPR